MQIRDRIKQLRRVRASELRPNPKNWRTHSAAQQDALRGVLAEIGIAGALLARELDDGSLQLIDGHLRAETAFDVELPVLVLDLTEAEADKILLTYDPLSSMAGMDADKFQALRGQVEFESDALLQMLDKLTGALGTAADEPMMSESCDIPESFQIVVECEDERQQRNLFEQFTSEGLKCRILTL